MVEFISDTLSPIKLRDKINFQCKSLKIVNPLVYISTEKEMVVHL